MRVQSLVRGAVALTALLALAPSASALQGPAPGAASAGTVKLPDGPGSVRGLSDQASLNVFSGQVSYSVPLELPKGPAGFAPGMALDYSGALGNGPVGIGWTLGEIAIRRTLRHGVPGYTDADELEVTGIGAPGRLVRVAANEYRVEGQANRIRVLRRGTRFDVTDANGTRYALGVTAASREEDGARTLAWLAESVINVLGQQITYTYQKDQGVLYLSEIAWAPGKMFRAQLMYTGRADVAVSYRAGFLQRWARRLQRIQLLVSGAVARTYDLGYFDEGSTGAGQAFSLSRLASVLMSAPDGTTLPALNFRYARQELAGAVPAVGLDGWFLNDRGTSFLDVDGDGVSDLVRLELGNTQYRKNLGDHFSAPRIMAGASDLDLGGARLLDLDGDARPELVSVVDETWRVRALDPAGNWIARGEWPGTQGVPLQDPATALVDLNGDGRVDVIRSVTGGVSVALGGPGGLLPARTLPRLSAGDVSVEPGAPNVLFADTNGDGLADVVWLTDEWMKILLGRGDGTFVATSRVFWPWGTAAFAPGDIQVGDLDRDGIADVVRFSAGHAYFYPGLASGRLSRVPRHLPRPENVDVDAVVTLADANGNGSLDVVWSSPRGMWLMDFAGPTSAGMLSQIDNGLGRVTTFSYLSSGTLAVAAENQGQPWTHKLPVAVPVAVRVETDPGGGTPPRVLHAGVRDGFWDGVEQRLGGFLHATEEQEAAAGPAETLVREIDFHPGTGTDRVLRGKVRLERQLTGLGDLLLTTKTDCEAMAVGGGLAIVRQVETFDAEGVVTAVPTRTAYEYDAEGRPIVETQLGRLDLSGDERIIHRTFVDDATLWVRDRLSEESVLEGDGVTVASSTRTYFGPPTGAVLPLGQVGQGLVRQVDGFLGPARWVTQKAVLYDACGNSVDVTANGVERKLVYDSNCLRPLSETVFPNGTAQLGLTWQMAWSYVLDRPLTLTYPSGDLARIDYDGIGRPTGAAMNSIVHTHFQYAWAAPQPRTTTWVFDGELSELQGTGQAWPTGSKWRQTVSVTDGAGAALFSSTPLGDGTFIVSGWQERDDRGQVVLSAEPFSSASQFPAALPTGTARPRVETAEHDALGRATRQVSPNGAARVTAYTAYMRDVTSDELATVRSLLDGQGRTVHTERAIDGVLESVDARYDAGDRILSMTLQSASANPVAHRYAYDTLGRLVTSDDPDVGHRELGYDDGNFLRSHLNGAGQTIFFDYDGAGRVIRRGQTATPATATDLVYTYDSVAAAEKSTCRVLGRLAMAKDASDQVKICYDVFGRQNGMARTVSPPGLTVKTASLDEILSTSGLLLTQTFDDGFVAHYVYDHAGRAAAINDGTKDLWHADAVDAAGRVTHETYGNGVTQAYQQDTLGLPSRITVARADGVSLFDVLVSRNAYGAPKTVTDQETAGLDHTETFGYDGGGRLTAATVGRGADQLQLAFQYDALQNMVLRRITGPRAVGALTGVYHYGEPKVGTTTAQGPCQLTSIIPEATP